MQLGSHKASEILLNSFNGFRSLIFLFFNVHGVGGFGFVVYYLAILFNPQNICNIITSFVKCHTYFVKPLLLYGFVLFCCVYAYKTTLAMMF